MLQDKYSLQNYSEANTRHPGTQVEQNSDNDFEPVASTSKMARRATQVEQNSDNDFEPVASTSKMARRASQRQSQQ